jgi:hypothetical protein
MKLVFPHQDRILSCMSAAQTEDCQATVNRFKNDGREFTILQAFVMLNEASKELSDAFVNGNRLHDYEAVSPEIIASVSSLEPYKALIIGRWSEIFSVEELEDVVNWNGEDQTPDTLKSPIINSVNLQMVDTDGNVVNEKTIEIQEGSNLIIKVPYAYDNETIEFVVDAFQNLGTGKAIFIPQDVELFILNVKIL